MSDWRQWIHPFVIPLTKRRVPHQVVLLNPCELDPASERHWLYQAVTDYPPLDWAYEQSVIFDPFRRQRPDM